VCAARAIERLAMHGLQGLLFAVFAVPMLVGLALVGLLALCVSGVVSALVMGYVFGP
jgi:hypothetical protein